MIAWAQKQLEIDYPSVGKVVVQSSPGFGLKKWLFEPKIGLKVGKIVTNFEKYSKNNFSISQFFSNFALG